MTKRKFKVYRGYTNNIQFVAEIECGENVPYSIKLGLAVKWAILSGANLYHANLSGADLSGANLPYANLSGANLSGANLSGAGLSHANLPYANLPGADLSHANLSGADLSHANLPYANLSGAKLYHANLSGADLSHTKNAELTIARTRILPDGDIIGWKKCRNNVIVKLRIPETAKRSHAFGRKCRAEYADVLELIGGNEAISLHDGTTKYIVGRRIKPDEFDENWQDECSNGINFYITRAEAEAHQ